MAGELYLSKIKTIIDYKNTKPNMNFGPEVCTVVLILELKWPKLLSKGPIFDLVFYNIKMPSCSGPLGYTLPLTGALKWGTVWTSSSTGTGIMKGRSWTFVFY